jgi:hypothetical protein
MGVVTVLDSDKAEAVEEAVEEVVGEVDATQ